MKQQNARVNYFFSGVYKDCCRLIAFIFVKCITFIKWLFGIFSYLIVNFLGNTWRVIVGVWYRLVDAIQSSWGGVGDAWSDFWSNIVDDIIDHYGFWDMIGGCFKALFNACKFGIFLSYFLLNLVFTPLICLAFSLFFLVLEVGSLVAVFLFACAAVLVLFVVLGIVAAITFVIMALIATGIAIVFSIVGFIDWLYRKIKKLSNGCPNCQTRFDLPVYLCPHCGREHTRLMPSKYGIFKRECLCGTKISTTFLNGRQKLKAKCPNCDASLTGGAHTEVWIPVIGGPSAGKTCYINMAITEIQESVAKKHGLDFKYHAQGDDLYQDTKDIMEQGMLPQKTSDLTLKYYQFFLDNKAKKTGNFISLCDVAGELYAEGNQFEQNGFKQADGFIFIVDPLTFGDYKTELMDNENINPADYGASDKPMEDIMGTLFATLDNIKNNTKSKIKPVCSIVFTKCDVPGLEKQVGESAINKYLNANPKADRLTAVNYLCENFLKKYGEMNFLQMIKQRFSTYQFFTCSSLGHNADGNKFTPVRVEDGILWILDKCCPSLSFDKSLKGKN